jgi:hypothetical protein
VNKVCCIACSNGLPGKLERGDCPRQKNGYDCGMYVLGELRGMADLSNRNASNLSASVLALEAWSLVPEKILCTFIRHALHFSLWPNIELIFDVNHALLA